MWAALTGDSTGGVSIDSYNLQWDGGSNGVDWYDLQGEDGFFDTALTYLKIGGLTAGNAYQFKVRANNVHGWGPFSIPTTIKAATQPDRPSPPVLTITNVLVKISWDEPYMNSG